MCQYVVENEAPLVVEDFVATEEFRDQYFCINYGMQFYAGTPLLTSDGVVIGALCLVHARPMKFGEDRLVLLEVFARAVVGRLELFGSLAREPETREKENIERVSLGERSFALLFLDLDNLKVINDSLGHQAGDELLAAVARRFERFLGLGYTVARFGGDEFTILLEDVTDIRDASRMSERILQLLGHPFSIGKGDFSVTCSAGVVLWTPSYLNPESLLRDADTAMYRAKSGGKSRYAIFEPNMNVMAVERMKLERAQNGAGPG